MENSLEAVVRIKWSTLCYKLLVGGGKGAMEGEGGINRSRK